MGLSLSDGGMRSNVSGRLGVEVWMAGSSMTVAVADKSEPRALHPS
jgi:hypothetical protein